MSIQNQLHEAELILKTVLENEASTSRAYLKALVITYFDTKKIKERKIKWTKKQWIQFLNRIDSDSPTPEECIYLRNEIRAGA